MFIIFKSKLKIKVFMHGSIFSLDFGDLSLGGGQIKDGNFLQEVIFLLLFSFNKKKTHNLNLTKPIRIRNQSNWCIASVPFPFPGFLLESDQNKNNYAMNTNFYIATFKQSTFPVYFFFLIP